MATKRKGKALQEVAIREIKNNSGTVNIAGRDVSITTTGFFGFLTTSAAQTIPAVTSSMMTIRSIFFDI